MIIWFTGTAAMMAVVTHLLAHAGGFEDRSPRTRQRLDFLGVVSALVSLPISVFLFGGVTTAGSTFVTAWLKHPRACWIGPPLSGPYLRHLS